MILVHRTALIILLLTGLFACKDKSAGAVKEDLETDGMEEAMRQEFLKTRDPKLDLIPTERLAQAQAVINSSSARVYGAGALSWQERGPNNIGGRTRAVIVDRRDATGNTVIASSVSGGIFRSTNFASGATTWTPVADQLSNLAVTAMLQDKTNGAIMYAGTGEGWLNIDAVKGAGVFKSIDGGLTWTQMASTATFEYIQDIEQDNNGNLYLSLRNINTAFRGVQRSTDGGATWVQVLGAPLTGFVTGRAADLEVATNGDIYATLGIFGRSVVMKSPATNGATTGALGTWQDIMPAHTNITQRAEIAVAPSNPQRVYLLMQDSASSQVKDFFRSSDGGTTWETLTPPAALNNGTVSQTWYNLICAVDPSNADALVVGGYHVAKSTDGGSTFTDITLTSSGVHVDQHVLVYLSSSKLIVGNDGGVYYSTDANSVAPSFLNKDNGFNVTQFYGVDYHPSNLNYFLAGAQDNNTQKFTSAGINATNSVVGGDGGIPHIRKTDGVLQIAATTANNFYRSVNSGVSFTSLGGSINNTRGQFINPSDLDDNTNTLFSGDDAGFYYCVTGLDGTPAGSKKSLIDMGSREVTAVRVDHSESNTVWLGASFGSVAPMILKVINANTGTPTVALVTTLPVVANAAVSCIDIDEANPSRILVTLSNYGVVSVLLSTDGGTTFTNIEGNLPDMPVRWGLFAPQGALLDGTTGGGILLATELGVWTTSVVNGASTVWAPNNAGLPNVRTDMLKYRASDFLVVAATHGRGLFTTNITGVTTGIPTVVNTRNFINYITANSSQLYIKTGNLTTTKMAVMLYDAKGSLVYSADKAYSDQLINVSNLASGTYILKLLGNKNEQYTRQFIK